MASIRTRESVRNRLLAALPSEDFDALEPHLETVHLEQRAILFEPDEPIEYVYFPETAVVSVLNRLCNGSTIEVGTTGCEGMAGLALFLGDVSSPVRGFVQVAGTAARMKSDVFARLSSSPGPFHQLLLCYTQAFLIQVAQTAACNGSHLVGERCAGWLLTTHDRVAGDVFAIPLEFLAFMLGVRRAGVTLAMRDLQDAGIVRYLRGDLEVIDRQRLEDASCGCYRVVRTHMERLMPPFM